MFFSSPQMLLNSVPNELIELNRQDIHKSVTLCRVLWRFVLRIFLISSSRPLGSCGNALSASLASGAFLGWMFLKNK